jgi:modulator of FtsH protease
MEDAGHWSDFFIAEVGAAAALSGLVIVAISINLQKILELPGVPSRGGEALILLLTSLLVCSIGLIPGQSMHQFGIEITGIGALVGLASVIIQVNSYRVAKDQPAVRWMTRITASTITLVPIVIGGVLIGSGDPGGFYWVAPGVLLALVAGVLNTWILLVEILR